jgi:hypothetical protein
MDKLILKAKLIEACRNKIQDSIQDLENTIADAQQQANDYGPPKDRYDSFRSQLLRRKDMLSQQLAKELEELKTLDKIDCRKQMEFIGFGSLVITSDLNYFISIGIGKIRVDNSEYYLISPIVPLSKVISGKKIGDRVEFRGKQIVITEVYLLGSYQIYSFTSFFESGF